MTVYKASDGKTNTYSSLDEFAVVSLPVILRTFSCYPSLHHINQHVILQYLENSQLLKYKSNERMYKIKQVLLKNNQTFYSNQKIVVMFNISRGRLRPICVYIVSHFKSRWNGKVMLHTEKPIQ